MLNRVISLFLCTAMLCSPWPVTGSLYAGEPAALMTGLPDWTLTSSFPTSLGTVESHFEADSQRGVILIQGAHDVPEAQKKIGRLLHYFEKFRNVDQIALEGAEGPLDTFFLRTFPEPQKLKEEALRLVNEGELSGGVWAALSARPEVAAKYAGLENAELYQKTLTLYAEADARTLDAVKWIEEESRKLTAEKRKIYSPELFEVDQKMNAWREDGANLEELLKSLARYQSPAEFPSIAILLQELSSETTSRNSLAADTARISAEALNRLQSLPGDGNLRRERMKQLEAERQAYANSEITPALFLHHLARWDRRWGLGLTWTPALLQEVRWQKKLESVEGPVFFREIERFSALIKRKLTTAEAQKIMDRQNQVLLQLKQLSGFKLSSEDWENLQGTLESPERAREIPEAWRTAWDGIFFQHRAFYESVKAREAGFLKALDLSNSPRGQTRWSVVVAGGFHTAGFEKAFRGAGITYRVISPKMRSAESPKRYSQHMRGDVLWKKYFLSVKGTVSPYFAFTRFMRDQLIQEKNSDVRMNWRDNLLRGLGRENRLAEASHYTDFLDEEVREAQPKSFYEKSERLLLDLKKLYSLQWTPQSVRNLLSKYSPLDGAVPSTTGRSTARSKTDVQSERPLDGAAQPSAAESWTGPMVIAPRFSLREAPPRMRRSEVRAPAWETYREQTAVEWVPALKKRLTEEMRRPEIERGFKHVANNLYREYFAFLDPETSDMERKMMVLMYGRGGLMDAWALTADDSGLFEHDEWETVLNALEGVDDDEATSNISTEEAYRELLSRFTVEGGLNGLASDALHEWTISAMLPGTKSDGDKGFLMEVLQKIYPDAEELRSDLREEGIMPVWKDEGDGFKPYGPTRTAEGLRVRLLIKSGIGMEALKEFNSAGREVGSLYRNLDEAFVWSTVGDLYNHDDAEIDRIFNLMEDPAHIPWGGMTPEVLAQIYFLFAFRGLAIDFFCPNAGRFYMQEILGELHGREDEDDDHLEDESETELIRRQKRYLFNAELGRILSKHAVTSEEAKAVLAIAQPGFNIAVHDLTPETLQEILALYPGLILQRLETKDDPLYVLSRMPPKFVPTFQEPGSAVVYFRFGEEMSIHEEALKVFLHQREDVLRATAAVKLSSSQIEMTSHKAKLQGDVHTKLKDEEAWRTIFKDDFKAAASKMQLGSFLQGASPVQMEKAGRERVIPEEELQQALENSKAFVQQFYLTYPVYPEDHPYVVQVNQILKPLIRDHPARVMVYESDELGAFALLSGEIFISSRLLKAIPNYEILRALLQHELRHIERQDTLYKRKLRDPAKYAGTVRLSEFFADMAMLREMDARGENPIGAMLLPQFMGKLVAEEEEKADVAPALRGIDMLHGSTSDREIVSRNLTAFFELPNLRHHETPFVLADPGGAGMTLEELITQEPDVFWRELRWHWKDPGSWQPVVRRWLEEKMGLMVTETEEKALFSFVDHFILQTKTKFIYVSRSGVSEEIRYNDLPKHYTGAFFRRFFVQDLLGRAGIRVSNSILPELAQLAVRGAFEETSGRLEDFDQRVVQLHRELENVFHIQQKTEDERGVWYTAWVSKWVLQRSVFGNITFDVEGADYETKAIRPAEGGEDQDHHETIEERMAAKSYVGPRVRFYKIPFRAISKKDYFRVWEGLGKPAVKFEYILEDIGSNLIEDPEQVESPSRSVTGEARTVLAAMSEGVVIANQAWVSFADNIKALKSFFVESVGMSEASREDAVGYLAALYQLSQLAPPLSYGLGLDPNHRAKEYDHAEESEDVNNLFMFESTGALERNAFDFLNGLPPEELKAALWAWQNSFARPAEGQRAISLALYRLQDFVGQTFGSRYDDDDAISPTGWNLSRTQSLEDAQRYVIFQLFSGRDPTQLTILNEGILSIEALAPLDVQDFFLRWLTDFTNEILKSRGYLVSWQARDFLERTRDHFKAELLQTLAEREGDDLLTYAATVVENLGIGPSTHIKDEIYEKHWGRISWKVLQLFKRSGRHPATVEEARGLFSVMLLSQDNMDGMNTAAIFFREMFRLTPDFESGLQLLERYRFLPPTLLYQGFTVLSEEKAKSQQQLAILQERFEFHMGRQFSASSRAVQASMITPLLRMIAGESRLTFFKGMLNTSQSDRDFKIFMAESWWKKIMTGKTDMGNIKEIARLAYFGELKDDGRLQSAVMRVQEPLEWDVPAYFNDWYPQFFRLDPFLIYILIENLTLDGPEALFRKEEDKRALVAEFINNHLLLKDSQASQGVIDQITEVIAKDLRAEDLFFFLGPVLRELSFQAPVTPLPDDVVIDELLKNYLKQLEAEGYHGIAEDAKFTQTRTVIRQRIEQLVRGQDAAGMGQKGATIIPPAEETAAKYLIQKGLMHVRADYQKRMTPMELGVESARHTGILAVRLVQLAGIYFKLSPDDQRAVLEVYDAVRGQLKVQAYSNLQRLKKDSPGLSQFLDTLTEIGSMIGGGSIVTVYHALLGDGSEIALGVQNPNAQYRSEELRRFLMQMLAGLVQRSPVESEEHKIYELLGKLLDRAHRSIVREINDSQFVEMNQKFWRMNDVSSRSLGRFKASKGLKTRLVVPHVSDTGALHVRADEFKKGQSLNYLVQEVSEIVARDAGSRTKNETQKVLRAKDAAAVLVQNYLHQIFESGLAHSDVHPGQYNMLTRNRLAIFDRKDLTRVSDEEKDLLRQVFAKALLQNREGVWELLSNYLMTDGMRAETEKMAQLKTRIFETLKGDESDTLLGKILLMLEREGVPVPDHWVGIAKNIIALNHMAKRVGFSDLYAAFAYDPNAEAGTGTNAEEALRRIFEVLPTFSLALMQEIGAEQLQMLYPQLKMPKLRSEVRISRVSLDSAEPLIEALAAGRDLSSWAPGIYRAADREGWDNFEAAYRLARGRQLSGDTSFVDALTAQRERSRLLATLGPAAPDDRISLAVLLREGAGAYWLKQAIDSGQVGTLLVDGAFPGQGMQGQLKQASIRVRPVRVQKPLRDGNRGIPLAVPGGGQQTMDPVYLPFVLQNIGDGSLSDEYAQTLAFVLMVHTARLLKGDPALAGKPEKLRSELRKIVGLQGYFDAVVSWNGGRGFEISSLQARVFLAAQTRQALEQAA